MKHIPKPILRRSLIRGTVTGRIHDASATTNFGAKGRFNKKTQ